MINDPPQHGPGRIRTAYLVEEQPNPSSEYFVHPALSSMELEVFHCRFTDLPNLDQLDGALLVFVRYVPRAWVSLVNKMRPRLGGLVFFMDDDVLDVHASAGMPLRYRFKLASLAAWKKNWLQRQGAALWVSTRYLLEKYAQWRPRLLLPVPVADSKTMCWVFYHGTASHAAEIHWLRPVMEEVIKQDEHTIFEIIGGKDVYRLYQGIPRVNVVHPMKWSAYRAFLSMPGRHIGLAPLLDSAFNRARSYTKFFDITYCGAVGIYSPGSTSAEVVGHEVDGVVVPLEREHWVEAILSLATNENLRQTLKSNAEIKLRELTARAKRSHLGLAETWAGEEREN